MRIGPMSRAIGVCVALAPLSRALAVPLPSEVPASWELRFRFVDPERITVKLPAESEPRTFWYMLYTVENESGQTVQFMPSFELVTETRQVVPAQIGVHPAVYNAIKRRHRKTYPFLTEPVRMLGPMLHGEDHARDSVAIWPQFDAAASSFAVYVGGLSGETTRIPNPLFDPEKPEVALQKLPDGSSLEKVVNPKQFTLQKTLVLDYALPGTRATRMYAKPKRQPHHWTMR